MNTTIISCAVMMLASHGLAQTLVRDTYQTGDFPLVYERTAADLWVDPQDNKVAQIATGDLAADIQRVSGVRPRVRNVASGLASHSVLIGTLGRSAAIDALVREGKLNVDSIRGKWESFLITVVRSPLPGVSQALVIAGSDRRATAFGVYELSRQIGVSPWYWWADISPPHRETLTVPSGQYAQGPPSVKYRGVFINDEDWGIRPWAGKTFDPHLGDIGPKTYQKVFELLLRLKANLLWPAMHESTQAFNIYPENKLLADDYAIVMSSSHAEPMLRNNVTEWDSKTRGAWDYEKNRESVRQYWDQRVLENARFENLFELGMRGIHDSAMPGSASIPDKVKLLEQIFNDQRAILSGRVNHEISKVPQMFIAYKEVLQLYQAGLQLPGDVILGWPDDNHGYIRQLSTPEEQRRPGGSAMYYHVSYWGGPHDYLWLSSTPPALIWEEMSKAFDYQTRTAWILNVGDIKPAELDTEYFLSMAWDMSRFTSENQKEFLRSWATREFGAIHAAAIADILTDYYRLGFARKPEHMGWNDNNGPIVRTDFTPVSYGDEAQRRLDQYTALTRRAEQIYATLPRDHKDAFYELVLYPVRAADLMNQKLLYADRSFLYAVQGRTSANDFGNRARAAFAHIERDTEFYNNELASGKWKHMMSSNPRELAVFGMPATASVTPVAGIGWGIAVEGNITALTSRPAQPRGQYALDVKKWQDSTVANDLLPVFDRFTRSKHFIDIFKTGTTPFDWTASSKAPWVRLSSSVGRVDDDLRLWVDISWDIVPKGENVETVIAVHGPDGDRQVRVRVFNPELPTGVKLPRFIESGGVISMEAENFTRKVGRQGAEWRDLADLGRTGGSVAVYPTTTPSINSPVDAAALAPGMEYDFFTFDHGSARILVTALPTQRIHEGRHLRYAISVDDSAPVAVNLEDSGHWEENVLRAAVVGSSKCTLEQSGKHTLKVWMMDPGVVLDKIVLDLGGLRPSYLGPPETIFTPPQ